MDFCRLVVREIHARCPRNSRKPCKTLTIRHLRNSCFFVVLLLFPLVFSDFSVSPVFSFAFQPLSVMPSFRAPTRNPGDILAAHTVPHRGAGSRRKDKAHLHCGGFLDSAFQRNDNMTQSGLEMDCVTHGTGWLDDAWHRVAEDGWGDNATELLKAGKCNIPVMPNSLTLVNKCT